MYDCGHIYRDLHGLTGSLAVHQRMPLSDFDWIMYIQNPHLVETCIRLNSHFHRELTFSMKHVYKKYSIFQLLDSYDLNKLFLDRWKYFRYEDMLVSISLVNPITRADKFLSVPLIYGNRVNLTGTIVDATCCYHIPYIIPIQCDGEIFRAFTWLFLYNGAFKTGDRVELAGRECLVGGEVYILIETPDDCIRKVGKDLN